MVDLRGKVVVVSGASRGLGVGIARSLCGAGAAVAVNYFQSAGRARALAEELGNAKAFQCDIRDAAQIARMVGEIEDSLGEIDCVVANATGDQQRYSIEEQTWQHYVDQFEYFAKSPLLLMQAVLPKWKGRRRGSFIQIGSEVVELGNPEFAHYVAAKGAQLAQTRSWARELGPWGIRVNLVAPGWIPTERVFHSGTNDRAEYLARVPLPNEGTPQDIGDAVAFLASDAARFITGQKIAVNGGNTLE